MTPFRDHRIKNANMERPSGNKRIFQTATSEGQEENISNIERQQKDISPIGQKKAIKVFFSQLKTEPLSI